VGTRADFYVGRGESAEWLGSIAFDGYPEGVDDTIRKAATERQYREAVEMFLASRDDATLPAMGWPWPWDNSRTTDYAYAFDGGTVYASCFGHGWFLAIQDETPEDDGPKVPFPDMSARRNLTLGRRSGLIVVCGL
jgi:hypothetical protein